MTVSYRRKHSWDLERVRSSVGELAIFSQTLYFILGETNDW